MDMTPQRWNFLEEYSREVFGNQDDHLAGLMVDAVNRGLPDIAVSPEVGRLLMMLTCMTPGRLALEVGTLGGYSGIWIARGLPPEGRLMTVESEPTHAAFAREQFKRAGVGPRVEIMEGKAMEVLPELHKKLGDHALDLVFLDAVKVEYPDYWKLVRPMIREGGIIVADNVYGSGWTIDQIDDPTRQQVDQFNRLVAGDPDFEAIAIPLRSGVLVGRRMRG